MGPRTSAQQSGSEVRQRRLERALHRRSRGQENFGVAARGAAGEDTRSGVPAQARARGQPLPHEDSGRAEENRARKPGFGAHEQRYVGRLRWTDAVSGAIGGLAGLVALSLHYGAAQVLFVVTSVLFPIYWVLCVAITRAYEPRFLYVGVEEFRRVGRAAFATAIAGALVSYGLKLELSRGYLLVVVTVAFTATSLGRLVLRVELLVRRRSGAGWMRRVLVAGHDDSVRGVVTELRRRRSHGHEVVGVCLVDDEESATSYDLPVSIGADGIAEAARKARADAVMVLPCHHLEPARLRRLAWELEGTKTQMLVAPGLLDVAHWRATVAPVGALALLHVDHAELRGLRRVMKEAFDRIAAAAALVVLLPMLALLMLAVRCDSRGPVVFRQERVGKDDHRFMLLKLRTMVVDAEARRREMAGQNDAEGPLFKIRDDPRVTRIGRFLRRFSLDELPQLVNVLLGQMSLVGPRPPLPAEVERYDGDVRRRLAVKPGITGLWQVSGRSDLTWEEGVRLDLSYVENWSLRLDLVILSRTVRAVLAAEGAY